MKSLIILPTLLLIAAISLFGTGCASDPDAGAEVERDTNFPLMGGQYGDIDQSMIVD